MMGPTLEHTELKGQVIIFSLGKVSKTPRGGPSNLWPKAAKEQRSRPPLNFGNSTWTPLNLSKNIFDPPPLKNDDLDLF